MQCQKIWTILVTYQVSKNHAGSKTRHCNACDKLQHLATYFRDYCKKVKFSHTRYRALSLELIPLHRQSAHR